MKAVAVVPGKSASIHLEELPKPRVQDIPNGRGVLVRILRVGLDGTDKEIWAGQYGVTPLGSGFLIIGHESFGKVVEAGPKVKELAAGDYVACTSRRRGGSLYDLIGSYDMTPDARYIEPGISLKHGFLTEYYVDDPEYIVRVPPPLKEVGVLLEPVGIAEKGIAQAYEIQRRMKVWQPQRAAVVGAGSLGLIATLLLRLRNLEVTTFARSLPPTPNSRLVEECGARYVSTRQLPLPEAAKKHGPFDLIFEAAGASEILFQGIDALAANGILVLTGISGGNRAIEVPADRLMLGMVLGNKVAVGTVSENRGSLEQGIQDMALASLLYPGWLERLITHRVKGLESYPEMIRLLTEGKNVIKLVAEVAEEG